MARSTKNSNFLCSMVTLASAISAPAFSAEPLRFFSDVDLGYGQSGGMYPDVVRQVLATMGRDVSLEYYPTNRVWAMLARGESDGILNVYRARERESLCAFPNEPTQLQRVVLFVRTADVGKLKFSTFDDLVGHDISVPVTTLAILKQPDVPTELSGFLSAHDHMIPTHGSIDSLRMLEAGRVDYAAISLALGLRYKRVNSAMIEPLLTRSLAEGGVYVCFSKQRIDPGFVEDFSRALKTFKATEAYQAIRRKYYP
ncbi:substrate-binding periplasmic protein [Bradyrhizobium canariense]|uniref:substrate-binding periplasmic protein n=1 Tax=Bradyrhizobium canariense TaxID=255045 RepID=UPI000A199C71|nr:transporter substrate-binding domain-containing protein [Bradyrhizobium canariense]OSI23743.1 hypothetical protein BST65_20785 [Bradyrhizobium canariense]OSI31000.1 hypothetical protein BST66_21060 [Bradyrhizobium canariense]OSI39905.1 hypothetical protein BSZ20_28610 [Bradyrhizobium canariense]OSI48195.1 hypothetical protein BST67_19090 [Bradyrhizobium canariense]OSI50080.1 hypothetical protein BSZ15_33945 [Bradyrhizobium canariense]